MDLESRTINSRTLSFVSVDCCLKPYVCELSDVTVFQSLLWL